MGDYTMTINKSDTFESEEEMKAHIKLDHDNKSYRIRGFEAFNVP